MITRGAYLARTRSRWLVYWSFAVTALGLAPIILGLLMAFLFGAGLLLWPGQYLLAIGLPMGIVGAVMTTADLLRGPRGETDEALRQSPLVQVHECGSYSEAEVVISCLGANGIRAYANSLAPDSAFPFTTDERGKIQMLARDGDIDAAYSILNTHLDETDVESLPPEK